jgi:hypothetical protein
MDYLNLSLKQSKIDADHGLRGSIWETVPIQKYLCSNFGFSCFFSESQYQI